MNMTVRERYNNDAQFSALVKNIIAYIETGLFTPTELREAVILAHIIYSEQHVGPSTLKFDMTLAQFLGDEKILQGKNHD